MDYDFIMGYGILTYIRILDIWNMRVYLIVLHDVLWCIMADMLWYITVWYGI